MAQQVEVLAVNPHSRLADGIRNVKLERRAIFTAEQAVGTSERAKDELRYRLDEARQRQAEEAERKRKEDEARKAADDKLRDEMRKQQAKDEWRRLNGGMVPFNN